MDSINDCQRSSCPLYISCVSFLSYEQCPHYTQTLSIDDPWEIDPAVLEAIRLENKAVLCINVVEKLLPGIPDVHTEGIAASLMKLDTSELENIKAMYEKCVANR